MCNSGHAVGRLRRQSNVTSTRIVLADYLGRPRMLLTVRVPPACDVNGVFAAMHSLGPMHRVSFMMCNPKSAHQSK